MKKIIAVALTAALCLTMLCSVALADSEVLVSWYTFGDVYLTSVRTALDAAFEARGIKVNDRDSNGVQQTQTDDINTAVLTGTNALIINLVDSGSDGSPRPDCHRSHPACQRYRRRARHADPVAP